MANELGGLHWVAVGAGRLALRGRPGKQWLDHLAATGCTRVVTLLSAREGAEALGQAIQQQGVAWTWLPLANASTPQGDAATRLITALPALSAALDRGEAIVIHCAAGIHRTGMVAYALLRWRGLAEADARATLARLRPTTANGMQARHFAWGDGLCADPPAPPPDA
ncbi:MAG: tyrosine-protein phosphatase [Ktedonobacterales bacterium]|nr:tyrosine-protein phosphatase [Ktedonobacterales bacterium]